MWVMEKLRSMILVPEMSPPCNRTSAPLLSQQR